MKQYCKEFKEVECCIRGQLGSNIPMNAVFQECSTPALDVLTVTFIIC